MTKHTPGPWFYKDADNISKHPHVQRGIEGGFSVMGSSTEQEEADARLISKSPELLEALKNCTDSLEEEIEARYNGLKDHPAMYDRYKRDIEDVYKARKLIKEATGEE